MEDGVRMVPVGTFRIPGCHSRKGLSTGGRAEALIRRTPGAMASGSAQTSCTHRDGSGPACERPVSIREIFMTEQY